MAWEKEGNKGVIKKNGLLQPWAPNVTKDLHQKFTEYVSRENMEHHTIFQRKFEMSEMRYQKKHDKG